MCVCVRGSSSIPRKHVPESSPGPGHCEDSTRPSAEKKVNKTHFPFARSFSGSVFLPGIEVIAIRCRMNIAAEGRHRWLHEDSVCLDHHHEHVERRSHTFHEDTQ